MPTGQNQTVAKNVARIVKSETSEVAEVKVKRVFQGKSSVEFLDDRIIISATGDVYVECTDGTLYVNGLPIGVTNKIVGSGCAGSAIQPTVECSPIGAPCEIHVTAGKTGKVVFKRSS